jgi:uncharacterized protein (TIGR04255 family)
MKKSESQSFPDYKNPPVIEVVSGISFEKIEKFGGQHLGLFWQKVRDKFPICQPAARLGFIPQSLDMATYLPRMWFVNEKQNMLIQLQDDKFYYNWRRVQQEETYPRYKTIVDAFKTNLDIFEKFLEEEKLGLVKPIKCELTYINHIPKREGWKFLENISEVFRDFKWSSKDRFLPPPIGLSGQTIFPLPKDKGHLNVTLQTGERKIDKQPMFILQLTATGLGPDKTMDAVWEWFKVGHEWIVCGFADLTRTAIQKNTWKRIDVI